MNRSSRDLGGNFTNRHGALSIPGQLVGKVFLEHGMEVGPTEAEGANAGAANAVGRNSPGLQFGVDVERAVSEVDVGIWLLEMETGREHLVAEGQDGFKKSRAAGGRL